MTVKDHSKLLGILFAIHAALQAVTIGLVGLIYGGLGIFIAASGEREAAFAGVFFLIFTVLVLVIGAIIVVPQILAAYKNLKNKPGARFWSIFAAIVTIINIPLGTALGIYALWFLFGEKGKQLDAETNFTQPPLPPNSWQ